MATVGDEIPQTVPPTANEITACQKVLSRFWSEPEIPTLRFRSLLARTALETVSVVLPDRTSLGGSLIQHPTNSQICRFSATWERVRAWEGSEMVWKSSRNILGYSPEELLKDGSAGGEEDILGGRRYRDR